MKVNKCVDHVIAIGYIIYDSAFFIKEKDTKESKECYDNIEHFNFCPNCGEKLNNGGKNV